MMAVCTCGNRYPASTREKSTRETKIDGNISFGATSEIRLVVVPAAPDLLAEKVAVICAENWKYMSCIDVPSCAYTKA
jgi:hypothetical protein